MILRHYGKWRFAKYWAT